MGLKDFTVKQKSWSPYNPKNGEALLSTVKKQ